jgi:hypothetical protein
VAPRRAARAVFVVGGLALVGELGHQLLERFGQALAHHLFHVVFAGAASVAFVAFVIVDVRRHGWPSFTWRTGSWGAERRP